MPVPVENILVSLKSIKKEKIWQVVNYLISEGELISDKEGKLSFQGKQKGK
jgi:hypothetical protein